MSTAVEYRRATADDLGAIGEVFLAAFADSVRHYAERSLGPQCMADAFGICLDAEPEALFVAQVGEQVAGYIFAPCDVTRLAAAAIWRGHGLRMLVRWLAGGYGVGLGAAWGAMRNVRCLWREARSRHLRCNARVFSIAVAPGFRGLGIGTGLLRAGLEYLEG